MVSRILESIPPSGRKFSLTQTAILTHEKNWTKWKLESCQPFEHPPEVFEQKRRKVEVIDCFLSFLLILMGLKFSAASKKDNIGNDDLNRIWIHDQEPASVLTDENRGYLNVFLEINYLNIFFSRVTKGLSEFLRPLEDQLNPDGTIQDGIEEEYLESNNKASRYYVKPFCKFIILVLDFQLASISNCNERSLSFIQRHQRDKYY
jgi:hypothetical protein